MTYTNWPYVSEVELAGGSMGIEAKRSIPKETIIGIYDGEIKKFPIVDGRLEKASDHKGIVQVALVDDTLFGVVTKDLSGIDFINHSCKPNIYAKDRVILRATRHIEQGEPLLIDYRAWDFVAEGISCWCEQGNCLI